MFKENTAESLTEAYRLFLIASQKQHSYAFYNVAYCLYFGKGVEKDFEKAFHNFELADQRGIIEGSYRLGLCLQQGKGVVEDEAKGFTYIKKAAEAGYLMAQETLAECYLYGIGIEVKDVNEANRLFWDASSQGGLKAIMYLGNCFEKGINNIPRNRDSAIELYERAAKMGYVPAIAALKRLGKG